MYANLLSSCTLGVYKLSEFVNVLVRLLQLCSLKRVALPESCTLDL